MRHVNRNITMNLYVGSNHVKGYLWNSGLEYPYIDHVDVSTTVIVCSCCLVKLGRGGGGYRRGHIYQIPDISEPSLWGVCTGEETYSRYFRVLSGGVYRGRVHIPDI